MRVRFVPELNEDEHETTERITVDSADNSLTWVHKAMFLGIIVAGVVAFVRFSGSQSGDIDEKTKA